MTDKTPTTTETAANNAPGNARPGGANTLDADLWPLLGKDPFWNAFAQRALVFVRDGGAEFGECMRAMADFAAGDATAWHDTWRDLGARIEALGDQAAAAGHRVSAREAWFRATNYYRVAYFPLYGAPVDPRLVETFNKEVAVFQKAIPLIDFPVEAVEIPFEGKTLPGYFARVDDSGAPRPTMVFNNGFDSDIQESFFAAVFAGIRRGYNVLLFDGPGQGRNLIVDGQPIRTNWETVVTPVIDYALTRPEIDPARIALQGWSLGGFLVGRAGAFEHRLAAVIADPGMWDLAPVVKAQLPLTDEQKAAFPDIDPALLDPMEQWLKGPEAPPALHWGLIQRGLWVFGAANLYEFFKKMCALEISSVVGNYTCPVFLSHATGDELAATAPQLGAALPTPHVVSDFTAAEGANMHVESLNRSLFQQRSYDWLDEILGVNR